MFQIPVDDSLEVITVNLGYKNLSAKKRVMFNGLLASNGTNNYHESLACTA
jgi:hypothetical protein